MAKNFQANNDDIDLIKIILIVWEGKWKIAVAVIISLIIGLSHQTYKNQNTKEKKYYAAVTEIKPINIVEKNKYFVYNNLIVPLNIRPITTSSLTNLYIKLLDEKLVFEEAMRKFNVLDVNKYIDENAYNDAISKLASSVKILKTIDKDNEIQENTYATINFKFYDVQKWKNVLKYADELANKLAKKTLVEELNNTINAYKLKQQYRLEDLSDEIKNLRTDYEIKISDRVLFLQEQSQIAKKLGIAKNSIELQAFGNENTFLDIKRDSPFYLRGYEAIDKEIELIKLRDESVKTAFIDGFRKLEKKKKELKQDQDKTLKRVELAFQLSPLAEKNKFSATIADIVSTKFIYKNVKPSTNLQVSLVIGLIIGVFYVLISKNIQSRKFVRKK